MSIELPGEITNRMIDTIGTHLEKDSTRATITGISSQFERFFKCRCSQNRGAGQQSLGSLKRLLGGVRPVKRDLDTKEVSQWCNHQRKILTKPSIVEFCVGGYTIDYPP